VSTLHPPARRRRLGLAALILASAGVACSDEPAGPRLSDAAERGREVFALICGACHHAKNPFLDGSQGPAIAGSSLELLEAKVLHNEYPPGYVPKRSTSNMVPLPYLKARLPDIAAFLNEVQRPPD